MRSAARFKFQATKLSAWPTFLLAQVAALLMIGPRRLMPAIDQLLLLEMPQNDGQRTAWPVRAKVKKGAKRNETKRIETK